MDVDTLSTSAIASGGTELIGRALADAGVSRIGACELIAGPTSDTFCATVAVCEPLGAIAAGVAAGIVSCSFRRVPLAGLAAAAAFGALCRLTGLGSGELLTS